MTKNLLSALLVALVILQVSCPVLGKNAHVQLKKMTPSIDQSAVPAPKGKVQYQLNQPLQGGVTVNVPRTPEAVAAYLKKMREIIQTYERLALASIFGTGSDPQLASVKELRSHTLYMIHQIQVIVPPAELKQEHNELAATLYYFSQFIQNPGQLAGGGFAAMAQLAPVMQRLHTTLSNYHAGVKQVIAYYKLSPQLDPFYGENAQTRQRLSDTVEGMKGRLRVDTHTSLQMDLGDSSLEGLGALGNMDLGGMDLSGLAGQLQNVDLGALQKLMGELNGGQAGSGGQHDSSSNLDHLFEQLQHQ